MNQMPPLWLDSRDPGQVASAKMIEALIGTPPRRLLIFTGVAMVNFQSNGQLDGQTVTIDLNARSNTPNPQFTATVGLASIYNEDSDLIFATDDVKVVVGNNLELLLVCNIAVMGDSSVLNRFSYQATVFLDANDGMIAGTIRWNPHFMIFNPPEQDLFHIEALEIQTIPGTPTTFPTTTLKFIKLGHTVGGVVREGSRMAIRYEITDVPMEVPIIVTVAQNPGAFLVLNSDLPFNFVQVSGPGIIKLTQPHHSEQPVDFEAREIGKAPN